MDEFELKFQVPDGRLSAVEQALRKGAVQQTRLRARYFDTPDAALARGRLALRLRLEGRDWVQTAKGQGDGTFDRLEHNAPVEGDAAQALPDLSRHDPHPVGKLLRKALEHGQGPLQESFETDVTRLTRLVESPGVAVEIALDRGEVRARGRSQRIQELEFELKEGRAAAAVELAQSWCQKHGLWLDPVSKAATGRRLASDDGPPPAVHARENRAAGKSAAGLLAGVLDTALEQVLGNARELAAGTGGDPHVHQLRVGLRRLRTALRELHDAPGLEMLDPAVPQVLAETFGVLGEHRDSAMLVPALREQVARAGGPAVHWQPELPDIGAAVRAPAFQGALLQLVALQQELGRQTGKGGAKATRKAVGKRLAKLHAQVERDGLRFAELAEAERHRVRKRLKRLRYLAELTRPLFEADAVDDYVKALKILQDALGEYQDAAAGARMFAGRAAQEPVAWFAAGWLAAREESLAGDCARACRKMAKKARPFWD